MSPSAALALVEITEARWKALSENAKNLVRDARHVCDEAAHHSQFSEDEQKANAFVAWVLTEPVTAFAEPVKDPYAGKSETIHIPYKPGAVDRGINRQRGPGSI